MKRKFFGFRLIFLVLRVSISDFDDRFLSTVNDVSISNEIFGFDDLFLLTVNDVSISVLLSVDLWKPLFAWISIRDVVVFSIDSIL